MEQVSIEKKGNRFIRSLLSTADELLLDSVREFVDSEVMPVRREMDASTRSGYEEFEVVQRKLLPLGLQGGFLPEEFGGMGMTSALTTSLLAEEIGRGDASLFRVLAGGLLAMRPAVTAGNRAVLEYFVPFFLREDEVYTGCFALSEPAGGSDAENPDVMGRGIGTRAKLESGQWVLDGAKAWLTNAGLAGVYCVACNTDPDRGEEGVALIYLGGQADGLRFSGFEEMGGLRAGRMGGLEMKGVRVPAEYRAAGPEQDAELLRDNCVFARIFTGALAVGAAQGAFDEVLAFSSDRIAAGKPIRQHTVCAAILADIAMGIQAARDNYVNAAYIYDHPDTYGENTSRHMLSRASMAKVFCCEAAVNVTNRAMELMGSYGYVSDYHIEKYWRDVKLLQLSEGGAQLARLDAARGYYDYDQFHDNELYERMRSSAEPGA